METQNINCPKCGTSNFVDDKECGACKSKLTKVHFNLPQHPKKNNYSIFILLFVGIFYVVILSCNEEKSNIKNENSFVPTSIILPNYTISKVEINTKNLFRIKITIENKLSESQLISIAKKAYIDIDATSSTGIIFFYLPKMDNKDAAWAKVDFPEMSTSFLGQSLNDEQSINVSLNKITDYVGVWTSTKMKDGVMIRIRKVKNEGYVFEYIDPNNLRPSELASPLKRIVSKGKIKFIEIESLSNEYYVIEENGDLSNYDKDGFIDTYKKLK